MAPSQMSPFHLYVRCPYKPLEGGCHKNPCRRKVPLEQICANTVYWVIQMTEIFNKQQDPSVVLKKKGLN